jgi:hypothetical protein
MAESRIKVTHSVEASAVATAGPGDTLIISIARAQCDEDIDNMYLQAKPLIDAGLKIVFVDNVSGMVVFRPKEA